MKLLWCLCHALLHYLFRLWLTFSLSEHYYFSIFSIKNLDSEDLDGTFIEAVQFEKIRNLLSKEGNSSFISLLKYLNNSPLLTTTPNIEIAMHLYCYTASFNETRNISFSVLRIRIKQYLRFFLLDQKISLSILNIEYDIL